MYKIFLLLVLFGTLSYATETKPVMHCILSQEGPVTISWKAYKTPFKKGVGGTFDKVSYTAVKKEGINFQEILVGSVITIDKKSVNSNNKGRDAKLVKFFFDMMEDAQINARIISIKPDPRVKGKPKTGILITEITMNKVLKVVPMHYRFDQGTLTATGTIDIFDFKGSAALQALNIACFEKHQGKTWNDVTIGFSTHIKALCLPAKK